MLSINLDHSKTVNVQMKLKNSSLFWWIAALVFTLAVASYQRITGPTYPKTGEITINKQTVKYKLLTSNESHVPAEITIEGNTKDISGVVKFKKLKTNEAWQTVEFKNKAGKLIAELPPQPPAGKLEYIAVLNYGDKQFYLTEKPVVIRFKGAVPIFVLIPHIIFMFGAMLYSTRTGIEAIIHGAKLQSMTFITLILLGVGGLILGPIVQKYAFGAFWTGWPFGHDLTDNKTFAAFVFWFIAYLRLRNNTINRGWAIAAAVILLIIFLIPHSMFGSELDYSTGEIGTWK